MKPRVSVASAASYERPVIEGALAVSDMQVRDIMIPRAQMEVIPVADSADVHDEQSLRDALARVQLPAILTTRRIGYHGKGAPLVRGELALGHQQARLSPGRACFLIQFMTFA